MSDFRERHSIAAPREALDAVAHVTFADMPSVRILFRLRGLPVHDGPVWASLLRSGFEVAGEHALVQRRGPFVFELDFWWEDGRLWTETRVHAATARTRRAFRPYWLAIRPFSGFVRRRWLKAAVRAGTPS